MPARRRPRARAAIGITRRALVTVTPPIAAIAMVASAESARANGRFPASSAIVFSPARDFTAVRTTFGLVVTRDAGRSWRSICERAIGFSGMEDPAYVVTKSGALVAALLDGIRVSRDGGCTWVDADVPRAGYVDLTAAADGAIFALQTPVEQANVEPRSATNAAASPRRSAQLWVSRDDARTFLPAFDALGPTLIAQTVEVARGGRSRVYVSAIRGEDVKRRGVLLFTEAGRRAWIERPFPLVEGELASFIAGVDPEHDDTVYLRTLAPPERGTRLLVTNDAGQSYRVLLEARGRLEGFALATDGSAFHVGGPDDGLFVATRGAHGMIRLSSARIRCLARRSDELWACAHDGAGFAAGPVDLARGLLAEGALGAEHALRFVDIAGPLECPRDSSVTKECTDEWKALEKTLTGVGGSVRADRMTDASMLRDANLGATEPTRSAPSTNAAAGNEAQARERASPWWMLASVDALAGIAIASFLASLVAIRMIRARRERAQRRP